MELKQNVIDAGGIYKKYSTRLEKLGIKKFEDFFYHIPSRYDDYSITSKIKDLQAGEVVTVQGKVLEIKNIFTRGYKKIQRAKIADETGELEVIWFNQQYLTRTLFPQDTVSLSGKIEQNLNKLTLVSPQYEVIEQGIETIHTGRLVPVYPETAGISSKWIRKQIKMLLDNYLPSSDFLPDEIIKKYNLLSFQEALKEVHFPTVLDHVSIAKDRLSFDELLTIQARSQLLKKEWNKSKRGKKLTLNKVKIDTLIKSLPFELTTAQKKAYEEILTDLSSEISMNRLLEGDVGSGKTVVGAIASYVVFLNKLQTAFIAPTEILATQHLNTLKKILEPFGVKVELVTSKTKLNTNDFDILIGTHAILADKINFKNLGLIIIDEQQRFGVEQRTLLRKKGDNPHVLTMTATPIPRTMALALYGDLDLTIIDQLPKNRKTVKTWVVAETKRNAAYSWIEKEIKTNKTQAFIICPFIEESESMTTVKAAKKEFEHLQQDVFKNLKLALLHGKQKNTERNMILKQFKDGEIDILVATPIVEVGIDIPNASIMVIEASERFGLSQLHQLRGRVGRGDKQSYCLLFTEGQSPKTMQRLKAMETINIGARLAEIDLQMRGAGNIYGTKQHGQSILKIANLSDFSLIEKTKLEAQKIVNEIEKYPKILDKINQMETIEVSPD